MSSQGQQKFEAFREKYAFLSYDGFNSEVDSEGLKVHFHFNLSDQVHFSPGFRIPVKAFITKNMMSKAINTTLIQHLFFQIGMIELISYWKAACPESILIKCGSLSEEQLLFWKKIYFKGLGEFFYTNEITTSESDFVKIVSSGPVYHKESLALSDKVIIPIGGGKDSVVSLELIKKEFEARPFILNPRGASLETCFKAGYASNTIAEVYRSLDSQLLRLNSEGYLNGHTPFSAMLAFYTLLVSALTGYKHIALSNESSANEATVAGTDVNHQYSKSFEFEQDFRNYVNSFISPDFNYFSFLRPLSELQIAMLFSRNVKYYPVFKSCNVGSKSDIWCGNCAKCLFAWTILSPFIPVNEMVQIFGKNLYEDGKMIRYLKELTGMEEVKPFECVGTIDEVNMALQMFIKQHSNEKWPLLIDYYSNTSNFNSYREFDSAVMLSRIETTHFLSEEFITLIREALRWKA